MNIKTATATKVVTKALRKNNRNNYRNRRIKDNVIKIKRKLLMPIRKLTEEKKQEEFRKYMSILHKMSKNNTVHPKKADRLIGRMNKTLKKTITRNN